MIFPDRIVPFLLAIITIIGKADDIAYKIKTLAGFKLPPLPEWVGNIPLAGKRIAGIWQHFITLSREELAGQLTPYARTAVGWFVAQAGSVAMMSHFWGFWLSMVILTFGELTLVPTASKYVADLAPADLRGRYMSIHWLGWGLARTLSPIIGGFLNDNITPRAIWIGGLLFGLTSASGLFLLSRVSIPQRAPLAES